MSATVRKQAPRLPRPAVRYWKGKAPKGVQIDVDSDSEESAIEPDNVEEDEDIPIAGDQDIVDEETATERKQRAFNVALKDVNISRDGKVVVAGREESGRTIMEEGSLRFPANAYFSISQTICVEESEEESEESDDEKPNVPGAKESEVQHQSSESESSEEEQPKVHFRPVFVPKRGRVTIAEKEALSQDSEEAIKKREREAEERRQQSHSLVADSIKRELAEKEKKDDVPDVDDTDGLDPTGEFEAWRLRELGRIKRDKEEQVRRDEEREEVERRRALPEEQRLKEDLAHAQKLREEKPKGKQKFLQKYWHKGAFHQDADILKRHDYTEATQSTIDVSLLPQVMQKRNFGKRSQTKYTHLLDQDTTVGSGGFGGVGSIKSGGMSTAGGGCFICGGPHLKKDCPQNIDRLTGANAGPTGNGARPWGRDRNRDSGSSWRDRDSDMPPPPPRHERDGDAGHKGRDYDRRRDYDDRKFDERGQSFRDRRVDDDGDHRRRRRRDDDDHERDYDRDRYYSKYDDRRRSLSRSRSPPPRPHSRERSPKRQRVH
ncbi:hypothetical protein FISHEDRAFT_49658 [Fistulina hepatica ATCC 64428]|uniref:Micro-fibrillar-associated protein 1 C-terminal domain-containing protein n=1 Tax=Fistulina hepatica ATCC 64428 TaxID=1128425 RepID=A0A0D7A3J1_9AGAR|nr:hypothetical protein FISHEDRAFT_49658 [Fistulina hepatica ATCC 64428]